MAAVTKSLGTAREWAMAGLGLFHGVSTCPYCRGEKQIEGRPCFICDGKGTVDLPEAKE